MSSDKKTTGIKPILLYDHVPGILAGYPAAIFAVLALVVFLFGSKPTADATSTVDHMAFWIGLSVTVFWYIAYGHNLPKTKFWLVFGLFGTFVGIPVVLEITGVIKPFSRIGEFLGGLAPSVNASAWMILAFVMGIVWLVSFIWSRTHLRVRIDESGLTLNQLGGKGERFELIGLKTENEPLDYLELFIAGIGSLSLKTRMNKPIFTMRRVIGLYRAPMFPFIRGKLARIEEILSYHGKVVSIDARERADAIASLDDEGPDALTDNGDAGEDADPYSKEIT